MVSKDKGKKKRVREYIINDNESHESDGDDKADTDDRAVLSSIAEMVDREHNRKGAEPTSPKAIKVPVGSLDLLASNIGRLVDVYEQKTAKKGDDDEDEDDVWIAAIKRRCTLTNDMVGVSRLSAAASDPRFATDPLLWPLLWQNKKVTEQWVEFNVMLGPMGRVWMHTLQQHWLPPKMANDDRNFLEGLLQRFSDCFIEGIRVYQRFPDADGAAESFFFENYDQTAGVLNRACHLAKELEGKNLFIRVGKDAARDFFAAWKMGRRSATSGPVMGGILSKVRLRSAVGSGNEWTRLNGNGRGRGSHNNPKNIPDADRGRRGDRGGRGNRKNKNDRGRGGGAKSTDNDDNDDDKSD